MHELSLCESMVSLVEEEASRRGFSRVRSIVLEIGVLGHVAPEAMAFCFDAVSRGTVAEGARLDVLTVDGAGWCAACARTVPLTDRFSPCPRCATPGVRVTAGAELRVRELEVE